MAKTPESKTKSFLFRGLDSNILIGMASDRYGGWIGQIYSEGRYEKGITRRSHKVGDKTFNEETLPVESVTEYFEHFPLLEIEYTFYRLLLEKDGKPAHGRNVPEEELATTFNSYRLRLRQDCYSGFHLSKPILLQTH